MRPPKAGAMNPPSSKARLGFAMFTRLRRFTGYMIVGQNRKSGKVRQARRKQAISPELREFLHMLASLEAELGTPQKAPKA
jgi:hypothetical protein